MVRGQLGQIQPKTQPSTLAPAGIYHARLPDSIAHAELADERLA